MVQCLVVRQILLLHVCQWQLLGPGSSSFKRVLRFPSFTEAGLAEGMLGK